MKCLWILAQRWFSEMYLAQWEAPAPCPSSRSRAVTARCAVARPLGPSGVLRQRRRSNADGEVPLIRSLLASLLNAPKCVRLLPDERLDSQTPLQPQLGCFEELVKSQFSPISPNPQAAFRLSSSVFSISCVWSVSCTFAERDVTYRLGTDDSTMFSVLRKA